MEAAVRSRRVTVRPAPDGMAYLSVLGPLKDVVGAHAALQARSRAVVGGQCPDEAPDGRGVGAVAADTALRSLSGRGAGEVTPVEVHLVMTDRALFGTGDPRRPVSEPARIPGHGSVPAPVARAWLRAVLDPPDDRGARTAGGVDSAKGVGSRDGAGSAKGVGIAKASAAAAACGCGCGGSTPHRMGATWSRWTPGGDCSPVCCAGCSCSATTCAPRPGARHRSSTPTTPRPTATEA